MDVDRTIIAALPSQGMNGYQFARKSSEVEAWTVVVVRRVRSRRGSPDDSIAETSLLPAAPAIEFSFIYPYVVHLDREALQSETTVV